MTTAEFNRREEAKFDRKKYGPPVVSQSSYYVGKQEKLLALAKSFAGRNELNGRWEGCNYIGTGPAVAQIRAFCDGYFGCLSSMNHNLRK